jgi:pyruvate dehydrogenase E2 component (dihydrolipoamide acetyltransferase)
MSEIKNIQLPDIGDFDEVEVIEILVSIGDEIQVDDSIVTLESDKASMEIPTPFAGIVTEIKVTLGDKIKQDDIILSIKSENDDTQNADQNAETQHSKPQIVPVVVPDM